VNPNEIKAETIAPVLWVSTFGFPPFFSSQTSIKASEPLPFWLPAEAALKLETRSPQEIISGPSFLYRQIEARFRKDVGCGNRAEAAIMPESPIGSRPDSTLA
jgi:hypothetical protein